MKFDNTCWICKKKIDFVEDVKEYVIIETKMSEHTSTIQYFHLHCHTKYVKHLDDFDKEINK